MPKVDPSRSTTNRMIDPSIWTRRGRDCTSEPESSYVSAREQ